MIQEIKFQVTSSRKILVEATGKEYVGQLDTINWKSLEKFAIFVTSIFIATGCTIRREMFCFQKFEHNQVEFGFGSIFSSDGKSDVLEVILSVVKYVASERGNAFDDLTLSEMEPSPNEAVKKIVVEFLQEMSGKKIKFPMVLAIGGLSLKVSGTFLKPVRKLGSPLPTISFQGILVGVDSPSRTIKIKKCSDEVIVQALYDLELQHDFACEALRNRKLFVFKINQKENEKGNVVSELNSFDCEK